jgi:HAD superfamily hydrolase (TIGR01450 family)
VDLSGTLAGRHDLVIFDLDGVVYVGVRPVPGAAAAIARLTAARVPVAYVTNNASRRATEVAALLDSVGVPADPSDVLTSAEAGAVMLARDLPAGAPVLVVGADALREEVAAVGLTPVGEAGPTAGETPVAVIQGYGPQVGWADLAEACVATRAGARWVATNTDATLPSTRGPLPGNGSLVAALSTALGRGPDAVVGKPEPALFHLAAQRHGATDALVVGDRLDTDIEGANRAGMASLLVLTGVTGPADLLAAPPHRRPTHVATDLSGLTVPEDAVRVPRWHGEVGAGGWRVTREGEGLRLAGRGEPVDALRALAAAVWANPDAGPLVADSAEGAEALRALGR